MIVNWLLFNWGSKLTIAMTKKRFSLILLIDWLSWISGYQKPFCTNSGCDLKKRFQLFFFFFASRKLFKLLPLSRHGDVYLFHTQSQCSLNAVSVQLIEIVLLRQEKSERIQNLFTIWSIVLLIETYTQSIRKRRITNECADNKSEGQSEKRANRTVRGFGRRKKKERAMAVSLWLEFD